MEIVAHSQLLGNEADVALDMGHLNFAQITHTEEFRRETFDHTQSTTGRDRCCTLNSFEFDFKDRFGMNIK